jgi:putative hydrolase of the HAD superfamily/pyrimidine and pyridine-specific 5'-nucleotidase
VVSLSSSAFKFVLPRIYHHQRSSSSSSSILQREKLLQTHTSGIDIDIDIHHEYEYKIEYDDLIGDNRNNSRMQEHQQQQNGVSARSDYSDTTNQADLVTALQEGTTLNATEDVFTVDEHNTPTATGHPRAQMRLDRMWHRATYIVIRHDYNDNDSDNDNVNETANATQSDTKEDNSKDDDDEEEFLLVQRRTKIKDYCPGKLDPTPGGVVGFGESYSLNATREMMEEMNIDLSKDSGNEMNELFTFPYQDDKVRVWGGMFEVTYRKPLEEIKMQPEEVSEVLRLSLKDIRRMAAEDPDDWMPDGLHAIRLYLQYKRDASLQRRLLKGYSNGDLANYQIRPKPAVILFDCDDCLYFDGWQLAAKLTTKIEEWCTTKKNLPPGEAYQLYKKHGTALKGLLAEGIMENVEEEIDAYLRDVHEVPVAEHLSIDNELREMILKIDPSIPKYIFTASVRHHAERCLKALGIEDLFVDIIDVKSCNLATKHSQEAFGAALKIANVEDPETVLFLDDSIKNIKVARSMGIRSFLVGRVGRDCGQAITTEDAEHELDRIHDLPKVLPEIFEY